MPALAVLFSPIIALYIKFKLARIAVALLLSSVYYHYFSIITDYSINYLRSAFLSVENNLTGNVLWALDFMGFFSSINIILTALGYVYTFIAIRQIISYISRT